MIAPMAKVQVLGPRRLLGQALAFLQAQGALELRSPSLEVLRPGSPLVRPVPVLPAEAAAERDLVAAAEAAEQLLAALPEVAAAPPGAGALPDPATPAFAEEVAALAAELRALEERRAALGEERQVVARYGRLLVALAPLRPRLPADLDPVALGLVVRPDLEALRLLESEVGRIAGGQLDLQSRPVDEEYLAVLLTVPRSRSREVGALLFERGVEEVKLPPRYAGQSLAQALRLLLARERDIPAEMAASEAAVRDLSARIREPLAAAAAEARDRLARLAALGRCGETAHAFVAWGWVPAAGLPALEAATAAAFGGRVAVVRIPIDPGEIDEVPVVLQNPSWLRPFERLLALLPMPRYGSIDPTPWLALFFPFFFGLVLGDMVCGVLGLAAATLWRRRGWGGQLGRDLSRVAQACSAWALLFGVLYGEALGALGERAGLRPLLIDRRTAFHEFLLATLAVGALHVLLGLSLGVVEAARGRRFREAGNRAVRLAMMVAAGVGVAAAAGAVPAWLGRPALLMLAALAVVSVVLGGLLAPLELLLSLGNVMSYARLMALGLASVMLAEVANALATAVRPLGVGLILSVLLHALNFTLGLVSPIVAALRLHYVEFFEKFYQGGGRPFRPFALGH
ncbi:MAG TPA: V-type ATPase 116kDa subunit family protein [Anaeromyxobacteraceae bacterium]|nr:V-type ATPase 116kDa subunit family protein [Anaeromyxobacteraceae bacterium]